MENSPLAISLLFVLTTIAAVWFFVKASNSSKTVLITTLVLLIVQGGVALSGFYTQNKTFPPHFALAIGPSLLFIAVIFLTAKGRRWTDHLNAKWLHWLHVVRVPVEITLLLLALHRQLPLLMTFEGRNFDIIAGLTAPLIAWYSYQKDKLDKRLVLLWNFLCLALLVNIIVIAMLSVETPFQQLAFEQPNRAIGYFPFIWLACYVAPVVLLAHLVSIRQLLRFIKDSKGSEVNQHTTFIVPKKKELENVG